MLVAIRRHVDDRLASSARRLVSADVDLGSIRLVKLCLLICWQLET